jgi:alpha-glucosidase (family GH31 glycosyl hydrolase)/putative sterol carrier protein
MIYTENFPVSFSPTAHPKAVVRGPKVRFTVLTSRLLRLEFDPKEIFEDRPSQPFWCRNLPVPEFQIRTNDFWLEIETSDLRLRYDYQDERFSKENISITLKKSGKQWQGERLAADNLLGTARTLDDVDGTLRLEPGLISRSGWAVYDDSCSLVFNEAGWLQARERNGETQDYYFFGYGKDYQACLNDFEKLAGRPPMIPRYILGNWWSRYWAYSADELLGLMDEFKANGVPLSVCVVDMDWHITKTGNASSGWTGYSWDRELFPDPKGFIKALHDRGLKTSLNLHPADGVFPHEDQYPEMAARLGIDPKIQKPIDFDIANPEFTRAYFEVLHHPHEADGVDFWWMDWQQGTRSKMQGLDPLWWLNHLHFYDLARNGDKRAFVFSRWGGLGNHRYPIGFSGDTHVTWESLAFQPYFTATAANVGFGWWSHDIGGHMEGIEDPELYLRWVQFGVFSPILRLHCTNNPFHERRPWGYDAETERLSKHAMRLRHAFIPYLYSMAKRFNRHFKALIQPMYHNYPHLEPAYHSYDQYAFGSELIAAPFLQPAQPDIRLSRQVVWMPEGQWFAFFSGESVQGNGIMPVYGDKSDIPVFAKAGAVVPLAPLPEWGGVDNPEVLEIHCFPGADNRFELFEDDGLETGSVLPIIQIWNENLWQIRIDPVEGSTHHLPETRTIEFFLRGLGSIGKVDVAVNGKPIKMEYTIDSASKTLRLSPVTLQHGDQLSLNITPEENQFAFSDYRLAQCQKIVRALPINTLKKRELYQNLPKLLSNPDRLESYQLYLKPEQFRALVETITGCGWHERELPGQSGKEIILWNNNNYFGVTAKFAAFDLRRQAYVTQGPIPRYAVYKIQNGRVQLKEGLRDSDNTLEFSEWLQKLSGMRLNLPDEFEVVLQIEIQDKRQAAYLHIQGQQLKVEMGSHPHSTISLAASLQDLTAMINHQVAPVELITRGRLQVNGNLELLQQLDAVLAYTQPDIFHLENARLDVDWLGVYQTKII